MAADLDYRPLLHELAARIQKDGWFPTVQDFETKTNRKVLPGAIAEHLVELGTAVMRARALRIIRSDSAFAASELERAAVLLTHLLARLDKQERGPWEIGDLQKALGMKEPNDVARAALLLWEEVPMHRGVVLKTAPGTMRPTSLSITNDLWDANVDDLLNEPPAAPEAPPAVATTAVALPKPRPATRKVFVVHGHDETAKEKVARVLEKLELNAVILHEQATKGRTLIEKFEDHAEDAVFAVALLTPDDSGCAKKDMPKGGSGMLELHDRARQNVVFEAGYFVGRLGRKNVVLLLKPGVEKPSDLEGIVYVAMDDMGGWRLDLVRELAAAGISVDANKLTNVK